MFFHLLCLSFLNTTVALTHTPVPLYPLLLTNTSVPLYPLTLTHTHSHTRSHPYTPVYTRTHPYTPVLTHTPVPLILPFSPFRCRTPWESQCSCWGVGLPSAVCWGWFTPTECQQVDSLYPIVLTHTPVPLYTLTLTHTPVPL